MPTKNNEKTNVFLDLEKSVTDILVVQNTKLKPFVELFCYFPENISAKSLGILLGFFKISDISEDSAYIVNFLNSTLKKEYYANPRRSVSGSVDAALHKVNLALSELAKHGNINWLGNLDAAICVLEKNNLHFSVSGKAKIILSRNGALTDIGENFNNEDAPKPNPLKVFTDVSSGRLEEKDKLIITSSEFFHVFSPAEIKKSIQRFADDKEKFSQFVKTALVNELEMIAAIIVDAEKNSKTYASELKKIKSSPKNVLNAFSEKSFRDNKQTVAPAAQSENKHDYIDKKTGHIYIQGEKETKTQQATSSLLLAAAKETLSVIIFWLKTKSQKNIRVFSRKLDNFKKNAALLKKNALKKENLNRKNDIALFKKKQALFFSRLFFQKIKEIQIAITAKFATFKKPVSEKSAVSEEIKSKTKNFQKVFSFFMPNASKIKRVFMSLQYHQRLYAILAVIAILTLPLIYLNIEKKRQTAKTPAPETIEEQSDPLQIILKDKAAKHLSESQTLFSSWDKEFIRLLFLKEFLFIASDSQILTWNNGESKEYSWPASDGRAKTFASISDLNLIFFLTDQNKLFSFSQTNSSFKENFIQFPGNYLPDVFESYLTYLYWLDAKNNQIYRYPRAEGGFGERINWIKEAAPLNNYSQIAIDENIYLASDSTVTKFFRGKQQTFSMEETSEPLKIAKILTNKEMQNIYILDRQNGRVAEFGKDGALQNQYVSAEFYEAKDFYVDEKNSVIYFITSHRLASFPLK